MANWRDAGTGLLAVAILVSACAGPRTSLAVDGEIRDPAVAGQFYPADRGKLTRALDGFFKDAVADRGAHPPVIVVPHAGYIYSGQIAADAFNQVSPSAVDTVVILGANHTTGGADRASVYDGAAFRTPLGLVGVDRELAAALVRDSNLAVFDRRLHQREHAVEVQVPFVQHRLPRARIVPVVVPSSDPEMCARFGSLVADAVRGRRALVVASSDLSHYPDAGDAARVDAETLEHIARLDGERLVRSEALVAGGATPGLATRACGLGPILVAIEAARRLGAAHGVVLSYANSASVAVGTAERAVGYGAVAFSSGTDGADLTALRSVMTDEGHRLDAADRRVLLSLARETIQRYLESETVPLPRGGSPALVREAGVFVTLRKDGVLRGCVGRLLPEGPVIRLVSAMALEAAFADPRYERVRASELASIDIEVSILSPVAVAPGPQAIVAGRDGVVLQADGRSAVFLPNVATEQGWGREELLNQLAVKAGLRPGAWRAPGARLFTFQADVFAEPALR